MCDCAELNDVEACGDDEQEFILPRRLQKLGEKRDVGLYVCPVCDTHWQVEHMQRGPLAIRVIDPFRWEMFDDLPFRYLFMERFHGGTGQDDCKFRSCDKRALKSMAFCVWHAYPELAESQP